MLDRGVLVLVETQRRRIGPQHRKPEKVPHAGDGDGVNQRPLQPPLLALFPQRDKHCIRPGHRSRQAVDVVKRGLAHLRLR